MGTIRDLVEGDRWKNVTGGDGMDGTKVLVMVVTAVFDSKKHDVADITNHLGYALECEQEPGFEMVSSTIRVEDAATYIAQGLPNA